MTPLRHALLLALQGLLARQAERADRQDVTSDPVEAEPTVGRWPPVGTRVWLEMPGSWSGPGTVVAVAPGNAARPWARVQPDDPALFPLVALPGELRPLRVAEDAARALDALLVQRDSR